ncbi:MULTISPECIES: ABC transporter ATP-binding protein [Caldisericum]|jgi:ABC-2 type transport system ATP-binding protein|uniref:Multidrug ABC transporter ATP-binding protein n=1 Tax=Caldisericum exile TaxID=693075 RepID=A0A2J6WDX9_9BACT|nr:MAG: multidrug ABC transporter ATP-binding protein [Caldisericum exile]PMP83052.1 MAG: multidrug ABC transporter ATP-binding protein [Caldisericum exile]
MEAIAVQNLTKYYGDVKAVDGISFEVHEGEIFGLIGPNGAGKTTTLRILSTIIRKNAGDVKIFGYELGKDDEKIRTIISYLPEEAGAYKTLTGFGYLQFMAGFYASDKKEFDEILERGISIASLGDRIKDKVSTYSKGMTRKLLLARALMHLPKLAILDEPTSGLDVINSIEVRNIIKDFVKNGITVLLSSHNMLEVEYLSDRVALIDKGKILDIGSPKQLKEKYNASNLEEVFMEVVK